MVHNLLVKLLKYDLVIGKANAYEQRNSKYIVQEAPCWCCEGIYRRPRIAKWSSGWTLNIGAWVHASVMTNSLKDNAKNSVSGDNLPYFRPSCEVPKNSYYSIYF